VIVRQQQQQQKKNWKSFIQFKCMNFCCCWSICEFKIFCAW
jgi:hypothetical protein